MRRMRLIPAALLSVGALALAACGSDDTESTATTEASAETTAAPEETTEETEATETTEAGEEAETADIVDTAIAAGDFTTLAALLTEAGLVETLKGEGPFTVFAPTDDAFAKVDAETLAALQADPELLASVLTYHVVSGAVPAADVATGAVPTVQGESLDVVVEGGTVTINGTSTVTATDVMASNGIIHVIDTVLIPPTVAAG
jgi:uncharacterized surface protein with fasciclin (FAS1) repeats